MEDLVEEKYEIISEHEFENQIRDWENDIKTFPDSEVGSLISIYCFYKKKFSFRVSIYRRVKIPLSFSDCIFEKELILTRAFFENHVKFDNCIFLLNVDFSRITINGELTFKGCHITSEFKIHASARIQTLLIHQSEFDKELQIINGVIIDYLFLTSCLIKNKLHLHGIEITQGLDIRGLKLKPTIWIDSIQLSNGTFFLENSEVNDLTILNSDLNKIFISVSSFNKFILNYFKANELIIQKSEIVKSIYLNNTIINRRSIFDGNFFNASFETTNFESPVIKFISDERVSYCNHLILRIETPSNVLIKGVYFNSLWFWDYSTHKDFIINILQCSVNCLEFIGFNNLGVIYINELLPSPEWDFAKDKDNKNWEPIRESFNLLSTKLSINKTSLGKIEFVSCNLNNFQSFEFTDSKITDVFVSGTSFPKEISNQFSHWDDDKQKQLGYGQIKKIFENRGDMIQASYYRMKELQSYKRSLRRIKGKRSEMFLLWLNNFSNQYGNSWTRALITTLLISSLLFLLYGFTLTNLYLSFDNSFSIKKFFEIVSYYPTFLSPVHKFNMMSDAICKDSNMSRIIDGISRIVIAYFIYQFIAAFRKHGKSSV